MTERKTPAGLSKAGRKLWHSIADEYEIEEHEALLLVEACRTADRLDALAEAQKDAPLTVVNFKGDPVASPYLVESRLQSQVLAKLIASLRLPTGDEGEEKRPQRRGGARGAYGIRGAV
ncbi:terminase [Georgenia deserti]|uniref:Terminase n=1 Tax=Georgenia deserti TaxID=2093781 RepID=A0ABW4L0C9_9MICO